MRRPHAPLIALGASLLLTLAATALVGGVGILRDEARFERARSTVEDRVQARLDTYVAMLYGVRGLFTASDSVTLPDYRSYVAQLETDRRYPGIQGIGFTRRIPAADTGRVLAAYRAREIPRLSIRPERPPRDEYHAIVYLEPLDRRNEAAIGYDMHTEPVRREGMARARDGGAPALSGKVRLVQEIEPEKQAGFLVYLPLYDTLVPPATIAERRERLVGFVYSPFRAGDFFRGIFSDGPPELDFRVYDGTEPRPEALLFDTRGPVTGAPRRDRFAHLGRMEMAGRSWTIAYDRPPLGWVLLGLVPGIAVAGVVVSFLLYRLTLSEAKARKEAERSEAARARFFAAMSHELRTPINAIVGYNDILLTGIYGPLDDRQRTGLERSQRAARHLTELVNDVLDLSKIEAGKMDLELQETPIVPLVEDLFTTIRPMAERQGSTVHLEAACRRTVRTDPRRVRQILLNLLSNAARFGAGHPVVVRCAEERGWVRIDVEDHGPGIAPDELERIFEEFVQLPNARTKGGTGLGLPISRRLAELLGGRLEVRSEVGRGSTFSLMLPVR